MNTKVLNWYGPIKFKKSNYKEILKDSRFEKSGVYIWTHEINKIHYVHYIGETSGQNFRVRFKQHFNPTFKGEACIYDFNCLQRLISKVTDGDQKKIDFFTTDKFKDYIGKSKGDLGAEYIENLSFFVCPLDENIENIESYLISKVALHGGISSKLFCINDMKNTKNFASQCLSEENITYESEFESGVQVDVLNI